MMRLVLLYILFIGFCSVLPAQQDWQLKKSENGIEVYLKENPDNAIKMLKIEFDVAEPLSKVSDALADVEACTEWVYACEDVSIVSANEDNSDMTYYTLIDFPWPLRDRDAYVRSITTRNDQFFKSTSEAVLDQEEIGDNVRILLMDIVWYAEATSDKTTHVSYTLKSDPEGMIPAWAINLAIDRGPIKSIEAFKTFVSNM